MTPLEGFVSNIDSKRVLKEVCLDTEAETWFET